MIFYSLQGLGNSVIAFPLLAHLRRDRRVRVVAYENGSADFFRAFHDDVVGVKSNAQLIHLARTTRADEIFVVSPTWRREIAAIGLTRAKRKLFVRPRGPLGLALRRGVRARTECHDLENNLRALRARADVDVDVTLASLRPSEPSRERRVLGLHPTASTAVKYYAPEFWSELVAFLAPDYDAIEMYCGPSSAEIAFCRQIAGPATLHAGLGFAELVPRLDALTDFVGTDSALMHLVAMLGRPTVGLWSYADFRRIFPYGNFAGIYIPRETARAHSFEAPSTRPNYLDRARAAHVASIVNGERTPTFNLPRAHGPPVGAYEF